MKKVLLVVYVSLTFLSGCSLNKDKYADFEHYDLRDYNHKIYTYLRNPNGAWNDLVKENYAISVLSQNGLRNGLLYEVGENDYILLYSFIGDDDVSVENGYRVMYKDKIYISSVSPVITEYTLDRESTKMKELTFDVSSILEAETLSYDLSTIDNVDDDNIYIRGNVRGYNGNKPVGDIRGIHMKCSLKDYKCIEAK